MNEYNNVLALLDKEDVQALYEHFKLRIFDAEDSEAEQRAVKKAAKCVEWREELEAQEMTAKERAEAAERDYENSAD